MSQIQRTKCDTCGATRGEGSSHYRSQEWFRLSGPIILTTYEDDGDVEIIRAPESSHIGPDGSFDFCSASCLERLISDATLRVLEVRDRRRKREKEEQEEEAAKAKAAEEAPGVTPVS